MVFKLVRTDTEEPCKFLLPVGTHLIGRGQFLDCDDKRVSRKHGELQVTKDTITIKSLHQNPCFYMKKGTKETQVLKQGGMIVLYNGDKFGLLPDSFWYELMHCALLDSPVLGSTEPMEETISATEPYNNKIDRNGLGSTIDDVDLPNVVIDEADVKQMLKDMMTQRCVSPIVKSEVDSLINNVGSPSIIPNSVESPSLDSPVLGSTEPVEETISATEPYNNKIDRNGLGSTIDDVDLPIVVIDEADVKEMMTQRCVSPASPIVKSEVDSLINNVGSPTFTPNDVWSPSIASSNGGSPSIIPNSVESPSLDSPVLGSTEPMEETISATEPYNNKIDRNGLGSTIDDVDLPIVVIDEADVKEMMTQRCVSPASPIVKSEVDSLINNVGSPTFTPNDVWSPSIASSNGGSPSIIPNSVESPSLDSPVLGSTEPMEETISATEPYNNKIDRNGLGSTIDDVDLPIVVIDEADVKEMMTQRCVSPASPIVKSEVDSLINNVGSPTFTPNDVGSPSIAPSNGGSPSIIPNSVESPSQSVALSDLRRDSPSLLAPVKLEPTEGIASENNQSPIKRCHSQTSTDNAKRIKIESNDVRQELDPQPGPSGDQGVAILYILGFGCLAKWSLSFMCKST